MTSLRPALSSPVSPHSQISEKPRSGVLSYKLVADTTQSQCLLRVSEENVEHQETQKMLFHSGNSSDDQFPRRHICNGMWRRTVSSNRGRTECAYPTGTRTTMAGPLPTADDEGLERRSAKSLASGYWPRTSASTPGHGPNDEDGIKSTRITRASPAAWRRQLRLGQQERTPVPR